MKELIILVIITLLLTGCSQEDLEGRTNVNDKSCLEIYCDKDYNVEYIRDVCWRHGGITIRLNENGNVIHCK
jgi:PBP1b-binding outer membrane lipoprotein LpoB